MPARPDERTAPRRRPSTPRSKGIPIAPRGGRRARPGSWPLGQRLGRRLGSGLLRLVRAQWPMALAVMLVGGGGTLGLSLVFPGGTIATPLSTWQGRLLGWTAPLLAVWLTAAGGTVLWRHLRADTRVPWLRVAGAALASAAIVGLAGLASYAWPDELADPGEGGGVLGLALARPLGDALGSVGAGVLLALALAAGVLVALHIPPTRLAHGVAQVAVATGRAGAALGRGLRAAWARRPDPLIPERLSAALRPVREEELPPTHLELPEPSVGAREQGWRARDRSRGARDRSRARGPEAGAPAAAAVAGPLAAPPPRSPWRLPPLGLLALPSSPTVSGVDLRQRARIIEETLESFHIGARVVEINEGPT